jgi:prepilin-type processing-associated H-X9-DG protein
MLPINESLTLNHCIDGSANTIVVGEASDFYYDDKAARFVPAVSMADPTNGAQPVGGWIAGTDLGVTVRKDGSAVPANRVFNLITIEHPIGINNRGGEKDTHPDWGTQGIGPSGLNNPLLSAHPAGAQVGYLDGHVQLLTKQTSPHIVKQLAMRYDAGIPIDFE